MEPEPVPHMALCLLFTPADVAWGGGGLGLLRPWFFKECTASMNLSAAKTFCPVAAPAGRAVGV